MGWEGEIRRIREELERVLGRESPGEDGPDFSRLSDEELARADHLLQRLHSNEPRRKIHPRARALADKVNPQTWRRHWERCPHRAPPEVAYEGELNGDELQELAQLLEKARGEGRVEYSTRPDVLME